AGDLRFLVDPNIATKSGGVTPDLPPISNPDDAAERSPVSRYTSAHSDAATEAGCVAHFFIGRDADGVPNLGAIAIGKRSTRQSNEEDHACRQQSQTANVRTHTVSSKLAGRRIMAHTDAAGVRFRKAIKKGGTRFETWLDLFRSASFSDLRPRRDFVCVLRG